MNFIAFELFLQQAMGLDSASLSPTAVARAVQGRMQASGTPDVEIYGYLLRTSESELQELIEAMVVPETWFFRDREAFTTLGRLAFEEWSSVRPGNALRLLSLPCSTGEEPYSMAMTLFDAGLSSQRFRVDAIDISRRALAQARSGVYGKNSFRAANLEFRNRYFEADPAGWHLVKQVRQQVHFEQGNLVDANLLPGLHLYDAIFCRNVLIYFDRKAQAQVIDTLDRLLRPEGILFMGPSETSLLLPHRFVPARLSHAFAFRKAKIGLPKTRDKTIPKSSGRRRTTQKLPSVLASTKPRSVTLTPPSPPADPLDEVLRLADLGHLSEAATRCEAHLQRQGPSARAYYLLGLISDAGRQQKEAAAFYKKALYLDPRNEEALTHLASLLKSQGDTAGAGLLLHRAQRLTRQPKA